MSVSVACADFNGKFKHRSEQCKEAIQAANNRQKSRDVAGLLAYELIYRHTIPRRTREVNSVSLPRAMLRGATPSVWKDPETN